MKASKKLDLSRLKSSYPFSTKLNDFINNWFEEHKGWFKFVDVDDFDENDIEGTFKRHKKRFVEEGFINIWTGASENTIFGCSEVNAKFRAWHDYVHMIYNLGYSITDESIVCDIQRDMLPKGMRFEKKLIECEIRGQAQYFYLNNKFVNNQREFTICWLSNTFAAINDPKLQDKKNIKKTSY